ncbi:thiamine biosynthesis protein ThiS [Psychromonas sp. psych-6C06]|uniref:sulfur carrier protein ThiS n=1 Tax=Psychromonas sp. psych-6C06 TaxID=2058089 RepID=UPI000C31F824|nr:sulfur carrier protein ThiS [Psychromonas sp. psych-6C06]PKF61710.1 thiamine biosynthesis protein ThiS [Psychromonas sp. psych-6C06]
MKVNVNEKLIELDENCNIEQLLATLESPLKGSAVAVNQKIISRSEWATFTLQENDQVSLFQAIAGG